MEAAIRNNPKKRGTFVSKPLFMQALKANWLLWLLMSLGTATIFIVINVVVCSREIFTNVNMDRVSVYVVDEGLSWLQILGLLEQMGFSLSRIEVMSRIDLNSVISDLVYKIAGGILPMIYVMIVSNNLLASQVSSGSMAYVLSTPTSRRTVVRTSYLYLLASLVAMYLVITASALASETIAGAIDRIAYDACTVYTFMKEVDEETTDYYYVFDGEEKYYTVNDENYGDNILYYFYHGVEQYDNLAEAGAAFSCTTDGDTMTFTIAMDGKTVVTLVAAMNEGLVREATCTAVTGDGTETTTYTFEYGPVTVEEPDLTQFERVTSETDPSDIP